MFNMELESWLTTDITLNRKQISHSPLGYKQYNTLASLGIQNAPRDFFWMKVYETFVYNHFVFDSCFTCYFNAEISLANNCIKKNVIIIEPLSLASSAQPDSPM